MANRSADLKTFQNILKNLYNEFNQYIKSGKDMTKIKYKSVFKDVYQKGIIFDVWHRDWSKVYSNVKNYEVQNLEDDITVTFDFL